MICVIATIETAAGKRDELVALFRWLVPHVVAEKGCIEYVPSIDVSTNLAPSRPDVVTVVEKWESVTALQAHLATPHMVEFGKRSGPLRLKLSLQIVEPA